MNILHGREACHPDVENGKIRIVLIYLDPENITAYEGPASEFDGISLDTIVTEDKKVKPERKGQPNIVVHTGLEDVVAKASAIEPKSTLKETLRFVIERSQNLVDQHKKTQKPVTGLEIFTRRTIVI